MFWKSLSRPILLASAALLSAACTPEPISVESIQEKAAQNDQRSKNDIRRAAHALAYSCAEAYIDINPAGLPPTYRKGLFEKSQKLKSWLRFSAGSAHTRIDDKARDMKGLAIKILGVDGPSAIDTNKNTTVHDILLTNRPLPFVRNATEQMRFFRASTQGGLAMIGFFLRYPLKIRHILRDTGRKLTSLTEESYWSRTAFASGNAPNALKYSVHPCHHAGPGHDVLLTKAAQEDKSQNYLFEDLMDIMSRQDICFELSVQTYNKERPNLTPIEDVSAEWKSSQIPVARIMIPRNQERHIQAAREYQEAISQKLPFTDFCESLSFNPWYALSAQRPIGELNKARLPTMQRSLKQRSQNLNYSPLIDPGLESFSYLP